MPLTPNESQIAAAIGAQAIVEKAIAESKPPPKTCELKQVLPASVQQMLEQFPTNDTIRAVVCAHIKVPLPNECVTFQQIRDWIETNIKPPTYDSPVLISRTADTDIMIPITGSETECGRCRYTIQLRGSGRVPFSREDMMDMIRDSDNLRDLRTMVAEAVSDNWSGHVDMDSDDSEYNYENYSVDDTQGSEWDWNTGEVERILAEAVRQISPEDAMRMGL